MYLLACSYERYANAMVDAAGSIPLRRTRSRGNPACAGDPGTFGPSVMDQRVYPRACGVGVGGDSLDPLRRGFLLLAKRDLCTVFRQQGDGVLDVFVNVGC